MDFQKALINSVLTNFPTCIIFLCFFHYRQAIKRNFDQKGLGVLKTQNGPVKEFYMIICGAFNLKNFENHVEDLLNVLDNLHVIIENWYDQPTAMACRDITAYAMNTYFKSDARFPPKLWDIHNDVDYNRSNNIAESGNKRLKSFIKKKMVKFINNII